MKPPAPQRFARSAYTLVEILVATALALLLMTTVVALVGDVGQSVTESRSMLESADRLRLAEIRLQKDLAGITAPVCPVLKPEENLGYFEYIEGPATAGANGSSGIAVNIDTGDPDTTVGDFDDILMFTTRTSGEPFVGRVLVKRAVLPEEPQDGDDGQPYKYLYTAQSTVAEVAWFLRGRTLHRRVLLVSPQFDTDLRTNSQVHALAQGFFQNNDISVHVQGNYAIPNTLSNLTRRECRFAHISGSPLYAIPWVWTLDGYTFPTLPTLYECSYSGLTGLYPGTPYSLPLGNLDFWTNASGYRLEDNAFIGSVVDPSARVSDDVILTNVIGFDVKAWDPETDDYEDLGHNPSGASVRGLGHNGQTLTRVYDTWSTSYYGSVWNDGIDDGPNGIVDDDGEKSNPPPYPIPLRGIQVKIRVFEPDSRQVRTVTVVQEFLPR